MELSYGITWTKRQWDGPPFPDDTLIQLLVVAQKLGLVDAVTECCHELSRKGSFDRAILIINYLHDSATATLDISRLGDAAVAGVRQLEKLFQAPLVFTTTPTLAIAEARPPRLEVRHHHEGHAVLSQAIECRSSAIHTYWSYVCSCQAIQSLDSLFFLLNSPRLSMDSENTVFTTIHQWLKMQRQLPDPQKQKAFKEIFDRGVIRVEWLSPLYTACYMMRSPLTRGLEASLGELVVRATYLREAARYGGQPQQGHAIWRSPQPPYQEVKTYEITAVLNKENVGGLAQGGDFYAMAGIAGGLPIFINLHVSKDRREPRVGLRIGWSSGGLPPSTHGAAMPVVGITFRIRATGHVSRFTPWSNEVLFKEDAAYGWDSFFERSWDEWVAQDSDYFDENGEMKVTISLKMRC